FRRVLFRSRFRRSGRQTLRRPTPTQSPAGPLRWERSLAGHRIRAPECATSVPLGGVFVFHPAEKPDTRAVFARLSPPGRSWAESATAPGRTRPAPTLLQRRHFPTGGGEPATLPGT